MPSSIDLAEAQQLDLEDSLGTFRDAFVNNDPGTIYLDGNSLGRLPKQSAIQIGTVVNHEWGQRLIRSWGEGWFEAPQRIGAQLAKLIGAEPDEVIVCDSTSVNLYKLIIAALQYQQGRSTIITDNLNFPSDVYIAQGAIELLGNRHRLQVLESADQVSIETQQLQAALNEQTALVSLSHTAFKSGWSYDIAAITELVHQHGALMLWDLCHSAGVQPLNLREHGVDLAVGCTYKYLNGGPGAPAFLYVRRELQEQLRSPIWGWFGQQNQFDMELSYTPANGINRFLAGTPSIIALAPLEASLQIICNAGIDRIREKSVRQTEFLVALWEQYLQEYGVTLNSPRDPAQRGSHISLGHPEALRISRALIERKHVIPDFRYPDNLRLGIAPLYTSYIDIFTGVKRLRDVLEHRIYEEFPHEKPAVT